MVPAENKATCFSLVNHTANTIQFISHFRPMLPFYTPWEYQPDPLFIVNWRLSLSFSVTCSIDVLERLHFQPVWRIFFEEKHTWKFLHEDIKLAYCRVNSDRAHPVILHLQNLSRWEECEQILEFIMNEETICLKSIINFSFLAWKWSKKPIIA